ncbi:MAG: 50S ribosomal protein L29 [Patescibacteria group bacterium]|nr:50S ribosomal protein L29 [Patescibacteria group bacterium]
MKISDIQNMKKEELERNLHELRNKLAKIRFDISAKQVKNHREARKTKKEIARILTALKSGNNS